MGEARMISYSGVTLGGGQGMGITSWPAGMKQHFRKDRNAHTDSDSRLPNRRKAEVVFAPAFDDFIQRPLKGSLRIIAGPGLSTFGQH